MPKLIIEQLSDLGFTVYESKSYLALLKKYPASGYEIAQESGVPRSVIYDVLRKLEKAGTISGIQDKPKKYIPLPPDQLISRMKNHFGSNISMLENSLADYVEHKQEGGLWNISGYENTMDKARDMLRNAKESIYLSAWGSEINQLKKSLQGAIKNGVHTTIFTFNPVSVKNADIFSYEIEESTLEQYWDHKIVLVTDRKEVLMGGTDVRKESITAWTNNQAIISIALNYIILDLTLYAQRKKVDVSYQVTEMMNGQLNGLENVLPRI